MENDKTLHNGKKQTNKAKIIKIEVLELLKSLLKDSTNNKLKLDKELAMCLSVANNTNSKVLPMYLIMDKRPILNILIARKLNLWFN